MDTQNNWGNVKNFPNEKTICFAIAQVFSTCVERVQQRILSAMVPHSFDPVPMVCYWPEYEIEELSQFVNQFKSYLKDDITLQEKCRVMILIYCHIMEAAFPSTVIWNLLRIMNHEEASWVFYGKNKKGEEFSCEFPKKRYTEIKKHSDKSGMIVGNVIDMLWHNKLRNAFMHAQYIIHKNGDFLGGKNISPITSNPIRPSGTAATTGENPYSYTFSEIIGLYQGATHFFRSFITAYKSVIDPYKTGNFFDIPTGSIRWDNSAGVWTVK